MLIFGALSLIMFGASAVRNILFIRICADSGKNLYKDMIQSLLGVESRFYDENPSGRLMNRFTKDTYVLDEILPFTLLDCLQTL
jgi:ATP-binding cassette subfamily C (CFTR/MRP) protein 4